MTDQSAAIDGNQESERLHRADQVDRLTVAIGEVDGDPGAIRHRLPRPRGRERSVDGRRSRQRPRPRRPPRVPASAVPRSTIPAGPGTSARTACLRRAAGSASRGASAGRRLPGSDASAIWHRAASLQAHTARQTGTPRHRAWEQARPAGRGCRVRPGRHRARPTAIARSSPEGVHDIGRIERLLKRPQRACRRAQEFRVAGCAIRHHGRKSGVDLGMAVGGCRPEQVAKRIRQCSGCHGGRHQDFPSNADNGCPAARVPSQICMSRSAKPSAGTRLPPNTSVTFEPSAART